jgi:hypothetical protein
MPSHRPGFLTTFGVLNIVFGSLFLLCGLFSLVQPVSKAEINGVDVTQQLKAFMNREAPNWEVYTTVGTVVGLIVSLGMLISGIGLLNVATWGRILALVCASVQILQQIVMALYQILAVNPAITRFFREAGLGGPLNPGFFTSFLGTVVVIMALLVVSYDILLIIFMLTSGASRAFSGRLPYDDEDRYPGERRRPGGRPAAWDEEDEDDRPRGRPSRRPDEDEYGDEDRGDPRYPGPRGR